MTGTFTEHRAANGVVYETASVITAVHGFSARIGGVSEGAFESLNLSFSGGDKRENVVENYRLLGEALGIDPFSASFTRQVHEADVRVCTDADRTTPTAPDARGADGLVTATPGQPIFCFTADCVPVLLHDPKNAVAAAVHCGWRSSVADILGVALGEMVKLGAEPGAVCAAIGPAIGVCCFETGPEVPEAVRAYLGGDAEGLILPRKREGKYQVDLRGANRRRLIQLGLEPDNIAVSDECTMCSPLRFWSHRYVRGGARGAQCAVIQL